MLVASPFSSRAYKVALFGHKRLTTNSSLGLPLPSAGRCESVYSKSENPYRMLLLKQNVESKWECNMTESDFLVLADSCLQQVQQLFEDAFENDVWDVDTKRSGNVLEIEFVGNGSKIIVNSQAPMQEMWVAARSGGFHYKYDGEVWRNTRDSSELFAVLRSIAEAQN